MSLLLLMSMLEREAAWTRTWTLRIARLTRRGNTRVEMVGAQAHRLPGHSAAVLGTDEPWNGESPGPSGSSHDRARIARKSRREEPLGPHVPDPIVGREDGFDPEHATVMADSVGLALLVVLDTLSPAERLAFVLHDVFAVPFDDIAPIVGRSSTATRQLASRARRRVQSTDPVPNVDLPEQRAVVDAFFAAARDGDFDALVAVLHPDVVLRSDGGTARSSATFVLRGAAAVAGSALTFAHLSAHVRPALVNGAAGVIVAPRGRPFSVMAFTVRDGRIVEINGLADPDRLRRLDLSGGC